MNCTSCGKQSPEKSTFCAFCGTPLASGRAASDLMPGAEPTVPPTSASSEYGGFGARLAAFVIDAIIVNFAGVVLIIPVALVLGLFLAGMGLGESVVEDAGGLVGGLIGMGLSWLYEAAMLSSSRQATLGKQALGLMVVDLNGGRLSFARASGRHFARYVSVLTLFIGYLIQPFTAKRQALHDMLAGTLVVKRPK